MVCKLKSEYLHDVTLRRRLARRGSSLESGDSLSDSAEWSDEDERRATLVKSVEECVSLPAGFARFFILCVG